MDVVEDEGLHANHPPPQHLLMSTVVSPLEELAAVRGKRQVLGKWRLLFLLVRHQGSLISLAQRLINTLGVSTRI